MDISVCETKKTDCKLTCKFCGKECKNLNSLRNHERLCLNNPNKTESHLKPYFQKGHKGCNQYIKAKELGLPKPELSAEVRYKIGSGNRGKHHSEEQRKHLSEVMKEKITKGEFIAPYKRNHSSKISYPEKYFEKVFRNENVFCEKEFQVDLYSLDFAWPDSKKYVEIDGEQHYVDPRIVEHDKERTEKLTTLGWKCICRIRWADYQKLTTDEKETFIKNVIFCIKNEFSESPTLQNSQYKRKLAEKAALIEKCKQEGKVDSLGRVNSLMVSINQWEERKNLILNSGVDLNKFGCLTELERKTGLTRRQISLTISKFKIFYKTRTLKSK